jgi:hypothetical protein
VYTERAEADAAAPVFSDPFLRDLVARPGEDGSRALMAALVTGGVAPQPPPACAPCKRRAIHFTRARSASSARLGSTSLRGPPARLL